jgi:hypothetical protein
MSNDKQDQQGGAHHRGESGGEGEGLLDKVKDFFTGSPDERGRGAADDDAAMADRSEASRSERDRTETERTETDLAATDRTETDRPETERTDTDLTATDRTDTDVVAADRTSDRTESDRADTDRAGVAAQEAPMTDTVSDSTDTLDRGERTWDGSDEPPELSVPGNEAVAEYSASDQDEQSGADDPARGGDPARDEDPTLGDDDEGSDAYRSRHGSGVDDAGVLADETDAINAGGLPGDGAITDESAVGTTPDETADAETSGAERGDQGNGGQAAVDQRDRDDSREREEEGGGRERDEQADREHGSPDHDVDAAAELRQRGDWTADEHGGPQVQEADGTVHDPGTEGAEEARSDSSSDESSWDDVRDGGHGWGSAAPLSSGAQPAGHPVKAWHDTMTFVLPDEEGYEGSTPHEWFVDAETAERAGFRHAHEG